MGKLLIKFREKNIALDVWENEAICEGKSMMLMNIKISKGYETNGVWKHTANFSPVDIPKIRKVVEKYSEWMKNGKVA